MNDPRLWLSVAVIALVTAAIRFLPFLLFRNGRKTPPVIEKLKNALPAAVMGMLVVYCLKDTSFASLSGWLPPLIACTLVTLSYLWKRNTLLSILLGTVSYMLLVQGVF